MSNAENFEAEKNKFTFTTCMKCFRYIAAIINALNKTLL